MGPNQIVSHKDTLREHPPDILLTNYKMLDYLLIRPKDRMLWEQNTSETLRYLVVDELHAFDGAQGKDLACLIRRLKARLGTPENRLCNVGTSATLGDPSEHDKLRAYAGEIFGEAFDPEAIIHEHRLGAGEFLGDSLITHLTLPPVEKAPFLSAGSYTDILDELIRVTPELKHAANDYGVGVLTSLLALVSAARTGTPESPLPFLAEVEQLGLFWRPIFPLSH